MLKPDRHIVDERVDCYCNEAIEPGLTLVFGTAGSGTALDTRSRAQLVNNPSGYVPAGLNLTYVVDIDQTRQRRNFQKMEAVVGEMVPLLTKGWVVTNNFAGSPTAGQTAYLSTSGTLTTTVSATGGTAATPKVGQFQNVKDADGYIKVYIDLPSF